MRVVRSNPFPRLIGLGLFVMQLALAQQSKDVIVMKNGDRLTGTVKSLEEGVLRVDLDYVDGTLSIDWGKVTRVESSALFIVTLKDGTVHSGTLITPDTAISAQPKVEIAEESGTPLLVPTSDVVRVVPTSESLFNRFGGNITSGSQYSKGNNNAQYSISAEVAYQETNWGARVNYAGNLSSSTGARTSTRNEVALLADRMLPWRNYFYAGTAGFLTNSVQGIDRQISLGGGIGRFIKNTNRMRFAVIGGAAWQSTRYVPATALQQVQNLGVGLIMLNLDTFSFKKTRLNLNANFAPAINDAGRNFAKVNASYYIKLFGQVDWNLSFYGTWDTKPPSHLQSSDYGTSTGLSYTFGTK